jgi:hypothetical protein
MTSDMIASDVHCSEIKSNGLTGGRSLVMEAAEFAKTSVIVNGVSVVVGELFGGGSGGSLDMWKRKNPMPQFDGIVRFDDSTDPVTKQQNHNYYVTETYGERLFHGSCTGMLKDYFPQFNGKAAYAGMKAKGRIEDPDDEYYGMSEEKVLAQWEDGGLHARTHGSAMHKTIEAFLCNCYDTNWPIWESPENKPALDYFLKFWKEEIVGKIVPFRTEMIMFDRRFEFSGQADFVYKRVEWLVDPAKKKWIGVGDWKRSKKFAELKEDEIFVFQNNKKKKYAPKKGFGICAEIDAIPLNEYRLQMSLYATCLMRQTELEVHELHLGIFHEVYDNYLWLRCEPLFSIADAMLVDRRQRVIAAYCLGLLKSSRQAVDTMCALEGAFPDKEEWRAEMKNVEQIADQSRSLEGLLRDMNAYGATTDEILGSNKRKKLGVD